MKRWFVMFIGLVMLLTALPVVAQDETKSAVFGGISYSSTDEGFGPSVGYGTKAGPIWILSHGKFGAEAGALELEAGKFFTIYKGLTLAVLAGPNADWVSDDTEGAPLAYLSGAAGGLVGWHWTRFGLYAGGKYKLSSDSYPDGWRVGVWLAWNP